MSLTERSNAEIKRLLTNYGIKHGPVVATTRSLYEKKLEEVMANDRTSYREEEEEITWITIRHPIKRKISANVIPSSRIIKGSTEEQQEDQQPEQEAQVSPGSSAQLPKDQQSVEAALVPPAVLRSRVLLHEVKQHQRVDLVHLGKEASGRRRSRGRAEGRRWLAIPALLLLLLTAGGYYTLSTAM